MNKEQKLALLKALGENPRVSKLEYGQDILTDGRDDSIWYADEVVGFVLDNKYGISIRAVGEIRLTWVPTEEDVTSKGSDYRRICEFLEAHGIYTDEQLRNAECNLYYGNNNWWDLSISDLQTGNMIMYGGEIDINYWYDVTDLDKIDALIEYYK